MDKKVDIQGWIRSGAILLGIAGAVYYFAGKMDAHVSNREIHATRSELSETFVTRREYDSYRSTLKDDLNWIKSELVRINNKLDRIVEKNRGNAQ